MMDFVLAWIGRLLQFLAGQIIGSVGLGGAVALVAGGVLLISLSTKAVRFLGSKRGMAVTAVVLLLGLAGAWLFGSKIKGALGPIAARQLLPEVKAGEASEPEFQLAQLKENEPALQSVATLAAKPVPVLPAVPIVPAEPAFVPFPATPVAIPRPAIIVPPVVRTAPRRAKVQHPPAPSPSPSHNALTAKTPVTPFDHGHNALAGHAAGQPTQSEPGGEPAANRQMPVNRTRMNNQMAEMMINQQMYGPMGMGYPGFQHPGMGPGMGGMHPAGGMHPMAGMHPGGGGMGQMPAGGGHPVGRR